MSTAEAERRFYSRANDDFNHELLALMRSRHPLTFITTNEEPRLMDHIRDMSEAFGYMAMKWTISSGFKRVHGSPPNMLVDGPRQAGRLSAEDALFRIHEKCSSALKEKERFDKEVGNGIIVVLPDFHRFMGRDCTPQIERLLKDIASLEYGNGAVMLVMTGPSYDSTESLDQLFAVIDLPLPNDSEIDSLLDGILSSDKVSDRFPNLKERIETERESIRHAIQGLTLHEIESAIHKSLVIAAHLGTEPLRVEDLVAEKQQLVRKSGILDFETPSVKLSDVGGLDPLVSWLAERKEMYSDRAREFGLPVPKGVLLLGVPGGGKSLCAKATASYFRMPLLKLDFGKLFGSLVGKSEERMRSAIRLAETLSPCILWCDEIEKGISGANSQGSGDSGTTKRVISTFLTWLNEKKSPVFVFATANNVKEIPPEFMRAGRFDETWFIDLPNSKAKADILRILLSRRGLEESKFSGEISIDELAKDDAFDGFSGAELEKAVDEALVALFLLEKEKRSLTLSGIVDAAKRFKPLSRTRADDFTRIRAIASECRLANTAD